MPNASFKTFTIVTFNRSRSRIRRALDVPYDEFLRPPVGWSRYRPDPLPVASATRHLRLRSGLVLRAWQYRAGGNGNAFVYALPETVPFPESPADTPFETFSPPQGQNQRRPEPVRRVGITFKALPPPEALGALPHLMDAFVGDGTPEAWLEASLLSRELDELGAYWHGISWGAEALLGADPFGEPPPRFQGRIESEEAEWEWEAPRPEDWRPRVDLMPDGSARVVFHTYSALGGDAINRHTDEYTPGSHRPRMTQTLLARGPGMMLF